MKKYPLLTIILSGVLAFIIGLGGSYYWARSDDPAHPARSSPHLVTTAEEEEEEEDGEVDDEVDTPELTPHSWELFLDYEGERQEMLGIIREHSQVNLRSGPGTDYEIVTTPPGGALLFPLDRFNQWYRIQLEDGRIGWIHESLVRRLNVPRPVVEELAEDKPDLEEATEELNPEEFEDFNRLLVDRDAVNYRSGPGLQFSIRGRVYRYQKLRLLGKRDEWYRVQTRHGSTGWVNERMVEPEFLIELETAPLLNEEELEEATLRFQPQFQFRSRNIGSDQFPLKVIDELEDWLQVKLEDGSIGWIPRRQTD